MNIRDLLQVVKPTSAHRLVRYGVEKDGGYVVLDAGLPVPEVLYTFGVGADISFEEDYSTLYGIPVHLYDPNITSVPETTAPHTFHPQGLATGDGSFQDMVTANGDVGKRIFFKADIEGAEWRFFNTELNAFFLEHVTEMVVEFHFEKDYAKATLVRVLSQILAEYSLVHYHINNVDTATQIGGEQVWRRLELTFVRKDLATWCPDTTVRPIPTVDFPNDPDPKRSVPKLTRTPEPAPSGQARISLFLQDYASGDATRDAENAQCLAFNQANPLISRIVRFQTPDGARPTFQDVMTIIAADSGPDDINIIANTDIWFDETIALAQQLRPTEMFCLTRWELLPDQTYKFNGGIWTNDAWIFRGVPTGVNLNVKMGVPYCDNRVNYEFAVAGYHVRNLGLCIKAHHIHLSPLRTWTMKDEEIRALGIYRPELDPATALT